MAPLRIVYLTAGAGGMFCGSCLHDNDVAKTLMRKGHEAILLPLYTPIRTDQDNASEDALLRWDQRLPAADFANFSLPAQAYRPV
ncbi:MAG: hypothetical protein U0930_10285 [Pirellulales bacterium]